MIEVKYQDITVNDITFTCKLSRHDDNTYGPFIGITVFEQHEPPRTFWQHITESFRYKTYSDSNWWFSLSKTDLQTHLTDICTDLAAKINRFKKIDEEWKKV